MTAQQDADSGAPDPAESRNLTEYLWELDRRHAAALAEEFGNAARSIRLSNVGGGQKLDVLDGRTLGQLLAPWVLKTKRFTRGRGKTIYNPSGPPVQNKRSLGHALVAQLPPVEADCPNHIGPLIEWLKLRDRVEYFDDVAEGFRRALPTAERRTPTRPPTPEERAISRKRSREKERELADWAIALVFDPVYRILTGGPWTLGEIYEAVDREVAELCRWWAVYADDPTLGERLRAIEAGTLPDAAEDAATYAALVESFSDPLPACRPRPVRQEVIREALDAAGFEIYRIAKGRRVRRRGRAAPDYAGKTEGSAL